MAGAIREAVDMTSSDAGSYIALSGGVGGARFAYGLSRCLPPERLLIAVNTGDDFWHLGLAISPDVDTVTYALAELDDVERGWGRSEETWRCMEALKSLGGPDWFQLGDNDLGLHLYRTDCLRNGESLGAATRRICERLGIAHRVVPMCDDDVRTFIRTSDAVIEFQDYFVRQQCRPTATGFEYRGADRAQVQPELAGAFSDPRLRGIVICPSNPWLSIGPMLAVPGIASGIREASVPVAVVCPIVGGKAIKGPTAKLMQEMGLDSSALEIARHYASFADLFVIDEADRSLVREIEALGMKVLVTNSIMDSRAARIRLARDVIGALEGMSADVAPAAASGPGR